MMNVSALTVRLRLGITEHRIATAAAKTRELPAHHVKLVNLNPSFPPRIIRKSVYHAP